MFYLILFLALFLRLIAINQSFWLDEAIQVLESKVSFWQVWRIPADFHPPLFHYLAWLWLKISQTEWWSRLLPVFLGLGSIWFVFLFAKKLTNKKIALLSSLFLATSPFHIYYSQEFRPYMLSCFLATASFYFFLKFFIRDSSFHIYRIFAPFVLVNIAGLYSLYFFPFIFITQFLIILLFYKDKLSNWLVNLALSFFVFLPWLPMFFKQLAIGRGWAAIFPLWKVSVATPLLKAVPLVLTKFWIGNTSFENKFFYGFLAFLLFLFFSFLVIRSWRKERRKAFIVLSFFLVPVFGAFLLSFFVPVIAPKRLLLTLPFFYLLLSMGVFTLEKKWQKLAVGLVLTINFFSLGRYYFDSQFQREQWRQAVSWVEDKASGDKSLVLFEFSSPFGPWSYYQRRNLEARGIFEKGEKISLFLKEIVPSKKQVFLFQYLSGMTDPDQKATGWLGDSGFSLNQTVDFPGVGFVYEYRK